MERNLTVYEANRSTCDDLIPKVLLQGKWLRNIGYSVGNKICVKVENQNLIVKLMD